MNIHNKVMKSKRKNQVLTIHVVNQKYDEGQIVFQHKVSIEDCKSGDEIASKILKLEHKFYPIAIESHIEKVYASLLKTRRFIEGE